MMDIGRRSGYNADVVDHDSYEHLTPLDDEYSANNNNQTYKASTLPLMDPTTMEGLVTQMSQVAKQVLQAFSQGQNAMSTANFADFKQNLLSVGKLAELSNLLPPYLYFSGPFK